MSFLLTQPLGLLALLGIPAILAIHFLRRKSVTLPITTLFLLESFDRPQEGGPRFETFRSSIPLWLQLAGVLALTWILSGPRWTSEERVIQVVFVLDDSASMRAFRDETTARIEEHLSATTRDPARQIITVMGSYRPGQRLYRGESMADALASLEGWNPLAPAHSPDDALRLARSLSGAEGTVYFLTDHPVDVLPHAALLSSVGDPIDNVGFTGFRIVQRGEEPAWQATVRNYGSEEARREWRVALGDTTGTTREFVLAPGELRTLTGAFPEDRDRVSLVLDPDRFELDDRLDLLVPIAKPLRIESRLPRELTDLGNRIIRSLGNVSSGSEAGPDALPPDLVLASYDPLDPAPLPEAGIVMIHQPSLPANLRGGLIVAENHPLTEGLSWQGLITRESPSLPIRSEDRVLAWQGEYPLILLRETDSGTSLLFNFDVARSNAERLPSFVITIHRFAEQVRSEKRATFADHFELGQSISLAIDESPEAPGLQVRSDSGTTELPKDQAHLLRAPDRSGFFEVAQGETTLLSGSAWFADTREADFRSAASEAATPSNADTSLDPQTRENWGWQVFLLVFLGLSLLTWWFLTLGPRSPSSAKSSDSPLEEGVDATT